MGFERYIFKGEPCYKIVLRGKVMNKIIPISIVGIFLLGGLGVTANKIMTTDNHPPNEPNNPFPPNDSINVSIDIVLCWTGGDPDPSDTVTYDVYFGIDLPPNNLVSHNQTETCYAPTELELNTTYFWQIIAWDNHGASTSGLCWSFTTGVNHPPGAPIIKGPKSSPITKYLLGEKPLSRPLPNPGPYNFTFKATDPDRDNVYYFIDWGDGTTGGWYGPYLSGEEVTYNHTWSVKGTYLVKAKAKDIYNQEGPWGTIQIPFQSAVDNREIITFIRGPCNGIDSKRSGLIFYHDIELFGDNMAWLEIHGFMIPTRENNFEFSFSCDCVMYVKSHRFIGFFCYPIHPGISWVRGIAIGNIELGKNCIVGERT